MTDNDISKSFDRLIENLKKLLPELNQQGSELIGKHQYHEAKEIISKAEMLMSMQYKLLALKKEWLDLELPSAVTPPSSNDDLKVSPETQRQFRSQPYTSSKDFSIPILQALVNLGGKARRMDVFKELEIIMGDQLSENDKNSLPSKRSLTRWQKNAQYARNGLLDEGLITAITEKGIWIITEKGREFLNAYEKLQN